MRRMFIWTAVALLALVFFYMYQGSAPRSVWIVGDDEFVESAKRALEEVGLNFVLKSSGKVDGVIDGFRKICEIHGKVYHMDWRESDITRVKAEIGADVTLVPIVDGKPDRDLHRLVRECGKILKGKGSKAFENGWLAVEMGIYRGGDLIAIYDPLLDVIKRK